MDVKEYLQNPCGTLSIPYWKAKTLVIPDSMRIIHCSNWNGQYGNFQRFFRIKHDLNDLSPIDYDYDTLSIDYQATQLCEMINESYKHENIVVSEQDIPQWKQHKTFREELCVYINADNGKMAASGIAEFDEVCREGTAEKNGPQIFHCQDQCRILRNHCVRTLYLEICCTQRYASAMTDTARKI